MQRQHEIALHFILERQTAPGAVLLAAVQRAQKQHTVLEIVLRRFKSVIRQPEAIGTALCQTAGVIGIFLDSI